LVWVKRGLSLHLRAELEHKLVRLHKVLIVGGLMLMQVGLSATEWSAVLAAVQHLADPQQSTAARSDSSSSSSSNINAPSPLHQGVAGPAAAAVGTSAAISGAAGSSSVGCQVAAELLAELLHLPCFLLMEFVEGSKLSDCPHAVDPVSRLNLLAVAHTMTTTACAAVADWRPVLPCCPLGLYVKVPMTMLMLSCNM
jgi:hypothetical protein